MEKNNRPVRFLPTETYFTLVRRQLAENGKAYVRITGMSMWPLLHHLRDGVTIEPVSETEAGRKAIRKTTQNTQADKNSIADGSVPADVSSQSNPEAGRKLSPSGISRILRSGDIVLFDRRNGRYALHRVIRRGKTGFTMAGDHQWYIETDLPYDQIVGIVSSIERNGHHISASSPLLKLYSRIVVIFTYPRIFLWTAARRLVHFIRPRKASP